MNWLGRSMATCCWTRVGSVDFNYDLGDCLRND
jgi:hypothetical protein